MNRYSNGRNTASFGQPGHTYGNPIETLIRMAIELKLNEVPQIADRIQKIAMKGDQRAAATLVKRLARYYYEQRLNPDYFLSMEDNLAGEILLGHTPEGKPLGLDKDDLVRHTMITGQSGSGKSILMKLMFMQTLK